MQHIFLNNYQLCSEINETVPQHFIHCVATHGRHVQYLDFLHTIIKAEGKYVKKCQDMIMTEVRTSPVGQELGGKQGMALGTCTVGFFLEKSLPALLDPPRNQPAPVLVAILSGHRPSPGAQCKVQEPVWESHNF